MRPVPPQSIWWAIEYFFNQESVIADWQYYLGGKEPFELIWPYLVPSGRTGGQYPCTNNPPCTCYHRVYAYEPDDVEAVCQCYLPLCPPIRLTLPDILLYQLDHQRCYSEVATLLGLQPGLQKLTNLPSTYLLGTHVPIEGFRFPVYLTCQAEGYQLQNAINVLWIMNNDPFILLMPTRELLKQEQEDLLRRKGAIILALDEIVAFRPGGKQELQRSKEEIFGKFDALHLPKPDNGPVIEFFPTPANYRWPQVRIHFRDRRTVEVTAGPVKGVYKFSQMGMVNRKTANPNKQWTLLHIFAWVNGTLDWDDAFANRGNQKRRELLAKRLRTFFRIDEDPFKLTKDKKGWTAKFQISTNCERDVSDASEVDE